MIGMDERVDVDSGNNMMEDRKFGVFWEIMMERVRKKGELVGSLRFYLYVWDS